MAAASVLGKWQPLKPCASAKIKSENVQNDNVESVQLQETKKRNSRVMVVGGTGRVGSSTAIALSNLCPDLRIVIAGRNREKGAAMVAKLGRNSDFAQVDIDDIKSLETALQDVDLVVHTAGPFQQKEKCTVLEAAIKTKTAYIDVCDDTRYAWRAKSLMSEATAANVAAITTAGICPGVSNVMAAELVRAATIEGIEKLESLRFYYFIAGTGGAGSSVLASTFLVLGKEVVAYSKGKEIRLKPYSGMLNIDFGKGIGKRNVYLLNLPEVRSAHKILGVPTVSARFGSAPFFWNWGMEAMANHLPVEFLKDKSRVQELVQLVDPFVRAIDAITGERMSIRIDLECSSGRSTLGILSHERLYECAGVATATFALAILEGNTQAGVWFPEEPEGIEIKAREILLKRVVNGSINFVMHKSQRMIETNIVN